MHFQATVTLLTLVSSLLSLVAFLRKRANAKRQEELDSKLRAIFLRAHRLQLRVFSLALAKAFGAGREATHGGPVARMHEAADS